MGFRHQKAPTAVLIFDWDDTICPSTFIDKFKVDSFKDLPGYVSTKHGASKAQVTDGAGRINFVPLGLPARRDRIRFIKSINHSVLTLFIFPLLYVSGKRNFRSFGEMCRQVLAGSIEIRRGKN